MWVLVCDFLVGGLLGGCLWLAIVWVGCWVNGLQVGYCWVSRGGLLVAGGWWGIVLVGCVVVRVPVGCCWVRRAGISVGGGGGGGGYSLLVGMFGLVVG